MSVRSNSISSDLSTNDSSSSKFLQFSVEFEPGSPERSRAVVYEVDFSEGCCFNLPTFARERIIDPEVEPQEGIRIVKSPSKKKIVAKISKIFHRRKMVRTNLQRVNRYFEANNCFRGDSTSGRYQEI